jgi:hypothetical protein
MAKRPKCVIGEYCSRHGFHHGAEAEELRERLEEVLRARKGMVRVSLRRVLDEVDARDSVAYVEAKGAT